MRQSFAAVTAEELKSVVSEYMSHELFRLTYEREQDEYAFIEQDVAFFEENGKEHSRCISHDDEIG